MLPRETRVTVSAHCGNGRLLACVHQSANVLATERTDERVVIEARIEPRRLAALRAAAWPGDSITVHGAAPSSAGEVSH